MDKLEAIMTEEGLTRWEGQKGVENLCKLCRLIGYRDATYFGQFAGGSYGDLIEFLMDNSGAVEALVNWVSENQENYKLPELEEESEEE